MRDLPSKAGRILGLLTGLASVVLWVGIAGNAHGFDLKPSEIRGQSSKKPISVLQNRYFLKAWRPETGLMVGTIMDEAYLESNTFGARASLFFNEWLGFEVQGVRTSVSDSADRRALKELKYRPLDEGNSSNALPDGVEEEITVSPDPEVNAIYGYTDFAAIYAPFYGKLNFLNQWIVYTDVYVTGGYAKVDTDQGPKNSFTLGIGERFYFGESWAVRVDYRDRIFTETRAGQETRKHMQAVDLGASFFFN